MKSGVDTTESAPLAKVWLKWKGGRQYEQLVYAPPGAQSPSKGELNGWKGYTVESKPGDWSKTQAFILDVVCSGDTEVNEWVLDWCAALFQQPGRHGETALVLVGPEGIGKNVFAETLLGHTFDGRHFRITPHVNQVLGEFNDMLSGCCLLVLDEAELLSKKDAGHARSLITAHSVPINRKGIALTNEASMLHWIFLTNNETNPTGYMSAEDRRYGVLRLSDAHRNDEAYFKELSAALEGGERAAFLDAMLLRDITRNLRLAPAHCGEGQGEARVVGAGLPLLVQRMRGLGSAAWNAGSRQRRRDGQGGGPRRVRRERRRAEGTERGQALPTGGPGQEQQARRRAAPGEGWPRRSSRAVPAEPTNERPRPAEHLARGLPSHVRRGGVEEDLEPARAQRERRTGRTAWTLPDWKETRTALARAVGVEPEALGLDDGDEEDAAGPEDNMSDY